MLNITVDEVKQVCNLSDLKKTEILTSKFSLIDALISDITQDKIYRSVVKESAESQQMSTRLVSFKHAFAYFVLAESLEFLNTNTTGSGIIKSTGFSDSRVELLSQYETEKRKQSLELKAYKLLEKYLNSKGKKRYKELKLWDDLARAEGDQAKQQILSRGKKCLISIV